MSQRAFPPNFLPERDFESRASGLAMLLLRVTLLGTVGAFLVALGITTWRLFQA